MKAMMHGENQTTARGWKVGLALFALGAITLSGCVATLSGCVARVYPEPGYGPTVMVAPPPPQTEVVGVAPAPGYIWMGGYWNWVGGRHVWVAGHWGPGRAGYHWVPHQWVAANGGWRLAQGHWER
jgi:hypothetical protein